MSVPTLPDPATVPDGVLPPTGRLRLGDVDLPAGRPVIARPFVPRIRPPLPPTLWATDADVPDAVLLWRRLVDQFPVTGLWPLLLRPLPGADHRPWDAGELDPVPLGAVDALDAEEVLATGWAGSVVPIGGPSVNPVIERALAPFGAPFPGLSAAAPQRVRPLLVETWRVTQYAAARIGLVRCRRPADAVALMGWQGAINRVSSAEVSAVLRSWEDRFGVVLAGLSFDVISLLVARPPRDDAHGLRMAAEVVALCRDQLYQGDVDTIAELGGLLVGRPVRHLWFD